MQTGSLNKLSSSDTSQHGAAIGEDPRVARILARSLFRDMKSSGIPQSRILEVASELIGLVTADLSENVKKA